MVRRNARIRQDNFDVHLHELSDSTLNVLVYCFFDVPDWCTELTERNDFVLAVLRLARELGVEFALPTRTLQIESEDGPSEGRLLPRVR